MKFLDETGIPANARWIDPHQQEMELQVALAEKLVLLVIAMLIIVAVIKKRQKIAHFARQSKRYLPTAVSALVFVAVSSGLVWLFPHAARRVLYYVQVGLLVTISPIAAYASYVLAKRFRRPH